MSLHRANVAPLDIGAVFSIVSDALTRRALEFAIAEIGEPPGSLRLAGPRESGTARGGAELRPGQRCRVLEGR